MSPPTEFFFFFFFVMGLLRTLCFARVNVRFVSIKNKNVY